MIIINILILTIIYSLPFLKNYKNSVLIRRICAISFLYSSVLIINTYYIQSIGSGIGIYSGYFYINSLSFLISLLILLVSSILLIIWPNLDSYYSITTKNKALDYIISYNSIENNSKSNEYSFIVTFNILGGLLLISSLDLVSIYLSIELQSFALYILTTIYKERISSTSAGLKYFLLGGLSSCIILLGLGILYSYTGITNLESIYNLFSVYITSLDYLPEITNYEYSMSYLKDNIILHNDLKGIILGLLFIISGFLFKIAASPFHNWAPDVYDESPTLVTSWITILPKISILIFLLELFLFLFQGLPYDLFINLNLLEKFSSLNGIEITNNTFTPLQLLGMEPIFSYNIITNLLLLSSFLSLLIGAILGLNQFRIKRLLAYSTINHIGFLLLALAVFSNFSIEAFIFYIIQYTITNLNIFLILLGLGYLYRTNLTQSGLEGKAYKFKNINPVTQNKKIINLEDIENISTLKGLFFNHPILSISFAISLFSFAGVPPLIGFFAKQQVLYASNSAGFFFLSIIAILVSVISASYYLKIIKVMFSISENQNKKNKFNSISSPLTNYSINLNFSNTISENLYTSSVQREIFNNSLFKRSNVEIIQQSPEESVTLKNYKVLTTIHSYIIGVLTLSILLFIFNPELILNPISIVSNYILNL